MNKFDPYREWLGLESNLKPTYYQLIGVSPSENDANVIRQHALRRLETLAGVDDPVRKPVRDKLVRRVKRAAKCLMDEERRIAYDRKLLANSEQVANRVPAADALALAMEDTNLTQRSGVMPEQELLAIDPSAPAKPSVSKRYRTQQRKSNALLLFGLLALLSLGGIGFLLVTQTGMGRSLGLVSDAADAKPTRAFDEGAEPLPMTETLAPVEASPPDGRAPTKPPGGDTEGAGATETEPTTVRPDPTREEISQLAEALTAARESLEARDSERANEVLRGVARLNKRATDEAKYTRLVSLTYLVGEYWRAYEDALESLEGGSEITVGERRMIVVESNPQELILRYNGVNKTVAKESLPTSLEIALADRWFDKRAASSKVVRGAMMAVSAEFTDDETREIWRQARAEGAKMDDDLELVLDDDYDLETDN